MAIRAAWGIAEATYQTLHELLDATHAAIADCPVQRRLSVLHVQSPKCGNNNAPLDKQGARRLLEMLLGLETHTRAV